MQTAVWSRLQKILYLQRQNKKERDDDDSVVGDSGLVNDTVSKTLDYGLVSDSVGQSFDYGTI